MVHCGFSTFQVQKNSFSASNLINLTHFPKWLRKSAKSLLYKAKKLGNSESAGGSELDIFFQDLESSFIIKVGLKLVMTSKPLLCWIALKWLNTWVCWTDFVRISWEHPENEYLCHFSSIDEQVFTRPIFPTLAISWHSFWTNLSTKFDISFPCTVPDDQIWIWWNHTSFYFG